jgi:GNAT superfamily N-acetyltransferase
VVVRRRLEVVEGRQLYGDVLGDLVSWADGVLVIRKRDGSLVSVNEADVVAGKPIPPPPAPRAPNTGETLARVAASGWPAVEVEPLGDWWLQAADGFTGRANSALPVGSPGLELAEALERVRDFYARRGLPAWIRVVVGSPLESELVSRGWVLQTSGKEAWATTEVWVCRVPTLIERLAELGVPADPPVELGPLDEDWERLYGRSQYSSSGPEAAHHVLTGGGEVPVALARLRAPSGELTAIGRGVVTGRWLGIAAVEVAPAHRRRGLAQRIMAGLVSWGAGAGAERAYLQFGGENAPARALYEKLGFRPDHKYRYYAAPS